MEPEYDAYVSGPMTGYPEFNFPEFERVTKQLREQGLKVFSPHETAPPEGGNTDNPEGYRYYLPIDVAAVCNSKAIALLHGWSKSKGCTVEIGVARAIGMPVLDAYTMRPIHIADHAKEIVGVDRGASYGHPAVDFARTAGLLSALWADKLKAPLTALDMPAMMRMVKESRLQQSPLHYDSLLDILGYGITQQMVVERQHELDRDR